LKHLQWIHRWDISRGSLRQCAPARGDEQSLFPRHKLEKRA
jgi:hypothetical protein